MIYIGFLLLAAVTVISAVKLSGYAEVIQLRTGMTGFFCRGSAGGGGDIASRGYNERYLRINSQSRFSCRECVRKQLVQFIHISCVGSVVSEKKECTSTFQTSRLCQDY